MLKKFLLAAAAVLCCLFASVCVGLYLRSEISSNFFIQPTFRVIIMVLACVALYFAARLVGRAFFPERKKQFIHGALSFSLIYIVARYSFTISFISYFVILVNFLFFESSFSRTHSLIFLHDGETVSAYLDDFLNLELFGMIMRYTNGYLNGIVSFERFFMNIIGNFILFMPFAFFLPILFKKQNNFFVFSLTVALISFAAELIQVIFMTGTGDIDDLLLNTAGACLLFGILRTKAGKALVEFIKN